LGQWAGSMVSGGDPPALTVGRAMDDNALRRRTKNQAGIGSTRPLPGPKTAKPASRSTASPTQSLDDHPTKPLQPHRRQPFDPPPPPSGQALRRPLPETDHRLARCHRNHLTYGATPIATTPTTAPTWHQRLPNSPPSTPDLQSRHGDMARHVHRRHLQHWGQQTTPPYPSPRSHHPYRQLTTKNPHYQPLLATQHS